MKLQNGFQLSAIQLSGALSFPMLMMGYYLGLYEPSRTAAEQIILGNVISFLLGTFYLFPILKYRVITVEMASFLYGKVGLTICSLSLLITLIGWSVIQMQFINHAVSSIFANQADWLNQLLTGGQAISAIKLSFSLGLIMIITSGCALIFDLPTFFRYAKNKRHGVLGLLIIYCIGIVAIQLLGLYLSKNQQMVLNLSHYQKLFGVGIIVTGLFTNAINIFSSGMILNKLYKMPLKWAYLTPSIVVLAGAQIAIIDKLPEFLEWMSCCAEIILSMTLAYLIVKGLNLTLINLNDKRAHYYIFMLTLGCVLLGQVANLKLLSDSFIVSGFISFILTLAYHGATYERN